MLFRIPNGNIKDLGERFYDQSDMQKRLCNCLTITNRLIHELTFSRGIKGTEKKPPHMLLTV